MKSGPTHPFMGEIPEKYWFKDFIVLLSYVDSWTVQIFLPRSQLSHNKVEI